MCSIVKFDSLVVVVMSRFGIDGLWWCLWLVSKVCILSVWFLIFGVRYFMGIVDSGGL